MNKGVINIIEFVTAVIILFISIGILFPTLSFNSKFSDATLELLGRDSMLTVEKIGKIYEYTYNATTSKNFFNAILPGNLINSVWTATDGRVKNTITVACNCSEQDKLQLQQWFSNLRINNRSINVGFLSSSLQDIVSSDVLLIYGYEDLNPYRNNLLNYIDKGNGIVMVADVSNDEAISNVAWQQIFGMAVTLGKINYYDQNGKCTGSICQNISLFDQYRKKPGSISEDPIYYFPWKLFYNIPIPVQANIPVSFNSGGADAGTPPLDPTVNTSGQIIRCNSPWRQGNFSIQSNNFTDTAIPVGYTFWICEGKQMYIDTDLNGKADSLKDEGETFQIANYYYQNFQSLPPNWVFQINYLENNTVWISFGGPNKVDYQFSDFLKIASGCYGALGPPTGRTVGGGGQKLPKGWCSGGKAWAGYYTIAPAAGEVYRSLVQANISTDQNESLPVVVLNGTTKQRAIWSANFSKGGVGDDKRLLLVSLVLWAANDKATSPIIGSIQQTGQQVSYIDAREYDMYEIYKFILGLPT